MPLNATLIPLYRIKGQDQPALPGLLALTPPRNAARGRDGDRLIVYLLLTGNSVFTTGEYKQVAENAAKVFYSTAGSLTNALKTASDSVNTFLLDRNMSTSARGQYAMGWLALAVLRDTQCILSLSGSIHAYWYGSNESKHFYEPAVSGKGLGSSQTLNIHYGQTTLNAGDRLIFCGRIPEAWNAPLADPTPSSLEATRRRLTTVTNEDLNAVVIQATEGTGLLSILSGTAEVKEEPKKDTAPLPSILGRLPRRDEVVSAPEIAELKTETQPEATIPSQPSAYAIPPSVEEMSVETRSSQPVEQTRNASGQREFPSSIPRAGMASSSVSSIPQQPIRNLNAEEDGGVDETPAEDKIVEQKPQKIEKRERREPSDNAKRAAKSLARTIELTRNLSAGIGERMKNFLPRLLPRDDSSEPEMPANTLMLIMALVVPLVVVTIASVVYLRYGRSLQYDTYLNQAQSLRVQAAGLSTPVEQRKAWESVLLNVELAESHRITPETTELRIEAEQNLDELLGITRLQFSEAFVSRIGINISRMAASETDLFMLNADNGEVLRAQLTSGRGFQLDTSFSCKPGAYDLYTVGPLVDILAMPNLNSINATLLGIDANGNLLYCEPGQVGRAIPLAPPDTNWGRVTAFTLDGNNLYVLDAISRAVWVYPGKDGAFVDRPYFFFGGQTPEKQDVIDLVVIGDDLYMLHADGHLSTCSYSRVESNPTRCQDPTPLINKFGAYQDIDLFGSAHFTQMLLNAPPNQSILILDADTQGVMSFASRSLELERQLRPTTGNDNPLPSGPVEAITVGPNHVLYLALNGQVYFSTEMP